MKQFSLTKGTYTTMSNWQISADGTITFNINSLLNTVYTQGTFDPVMWESGFEAAYYFVASLVEDEGITDPHIILSELLKEKNSWHTTSIQEGNS